MRFSFLPQGEMFIHTSKCCSECFCCLKLQAKQDAEKLVTEKKSLEGLIDSKEKEMEEVQEIRDAFLSAVGNLVHETVPCHKDEVGLSPHACIIAQKE
jgi:seryl-tRNA synthetase